MSEEMPVTFDVAGTPLIGILHLPDPAPRAGVVVVVGGPQYRVGSHRQFLLLARELAQRGIAVLRFDCRGMGDSAGEFPGFENIDADVAGAVNALRRHAPSVRQIFLWGLCDATLAICAQAAREPRISGVVLLNPWVRTEAGQARAQLKHYYLRRVTDPDFLLKILRGRFNPVAALSSFAGNLHRAFRRGVPSLSDVVPGAAAANPLAQHMAQNLARFPGRILLILSGRDLTAKEFEDVAQTSKPWRALYADKRMTVRHLTESDHTFSRRAWRNQVASWTSEWVASQIAHDR
jgi:exosortase A-associated hydrolase 1